MKRWRKLLYCTEMKIKVNYQSPAVPRSLVSTNSIFVDRHISGSDSEPIGLITLPTEVEMENGRFLDMNLDKNGFTLVTHSYDHINYYEEDQILSTYYPECCNLVRKHTGAREVFAFDHNIRTSAKKSWLNENSNSQPLVNKARINGGSEVQTPAMIVHNDYTVTSAPLRIKLLSEAPRVNDVLRKILGETPVIPPTRTEEILKGAFRNSFSRH